MSVLRIEELMKTFGDKVVLDGMNLDVGDGEFISFLGPSGCGKTTTLNIIAGFIPPDSGRVIIGAEDVTRQPANKRDTAMVFQNYALFPHLTVAKNIGYGLKIRRIPEGDRNNRVAEILRLLGIESLADHYPSQLSGGQQQRVAVARSLVVRPGALLMDEPLSNLDAKLRGEIRIELRAMQQKLGQTVVFVTHDQDEALTMSDRIVVMNAGKVEQVGTSTEVYESPRTVFVADFLGVSNVLEGSSANGGWTSTSGLRIDGYLTDVSYLGIRPTDISVHPESYRGAAGEVTVRGTVLSSSYMGDTVGLEVETSTGQFSVTIPRMSTMVRPGDPVTLAITADAILPLEASVSANQAVSAA